MMRSSATWMTTSLIKRSHQDSSWSISSAQSIQASSRRWSNLKQMRDLRSKLRTKLEITFLPPMNGSMLCRSTRLNQVSTNFCWFLTLISLQRKRASSSRSWKPRQNQDSRERERPNTSWRLLFRASRRERQSHQSFETRKLICMATSRLSILGLNNPQMCSWPQHRRQTIWKRRNESMFVKLFYAILNHFEA